MHSPHRRGHRTAALTLSMAYAAILLTGCTSGSSPSPSTTTPSNSTSSSGTTSPTTTSSPSPTVSLDIPAAAKEKSIKGGTEFAKWFMNKASQSYVSLDTSWMPAVSTAPCRACALLTQDIAAMKNRGERLSISRFRLTASSTTPDSAPPTVDVDLLGVDQAADILGSNGQVVRHVKERKSWGRLTVTWMADGWRLVELAEVTP